jgi:hypothetical protein
VFSVFSRLGIVVFEDLENLLQQRFWKEFAFVQIKDAGKIRNISPLEHFYFGAQYIAFADSQKEAQFSVIHPTGIKDLWSSYNFLHQIHVEHMKKVLNYLVKQKKCGDADVFQINEREVKTLANLGCR